MTDNRIPNLPPLPEIADSDFVPWSDADRAADFGDLLGTAPVTPENHLWHWSDDDQCYVCPTCGPGTLCMAEDGRPDDEESDLADLNPA